MLFLYAMTSKAITLQNGKIYITEAESPVAIVLSDQAKERNDNIMSKKIKMLLVILTVVVQLITSFNIFDGGMNYVMAASQDNLEISDEYALFLMVNKVRQEHGLDPYIWNAVDMYDGAYVRAQECSQYWSHTRPDGTPFWTANEKWFYGENLAYTSGSYEHAFELWMKSDSHREAILDSGFKSIVIARYDAGAYDYYAMEFSYD